MTYELPRECISDLASHQYELATQCLEGKRYLWGLVVIKGTDAAMRGFAQAEHLYRKAGDELSANLCRSTLRGLAKSDGHRDEVWLEGYRDVVATLKVLENHGSKLLEEAL
jgi:hypothetical protein